MGISKTRRGIACALGAVALAGLLAACNGGPPTPAPVVIKGPGDAGWNGPPPEASYAPPNSYSRPQSYVPPRPPSYVTTGPIASAPIGPPPTVPLSPPPGHTIVVEPGQSLGGLARRYHVPERAIIEANRLQPPYKIEIGARLVIPGSEAPPPAEQAALSPPPARQPDVIPLDGPAPPPAGREGPTPRAAEAAPAAPPRESLRPPPETAPPPPPPPGEASVAAEARADSAPPRTAGAAPPPAAHGGRFPWPVRGSIVGAYGAGANGAKNDGINIAAPLGTPVRAVEGGEVAYAGNELKGYGNLILVKHADGWISAYAHCQELLVRKGEQVAAGQVIAKVGTTGGVSQPQLHFELRRGQRPVDPREFLGPAPSAGKAPAAG